MTQPIRNLTTRASLSATASHNARWFAGMIAGAAALGLSAANAQVWNGSVSSSWNEPNNWTPAAVPNGVNTSINTITPNFPVVTSNLLFNPNDIIIGMGAGTTGRMDQSAGQVNSNAWVYVGAQGGNGTLNLTGDGRLAVAGRLYLGGSFTVAGGTGVATVNTTQGLTMGNDLAVGSGGGTGTLNLQAGTVVSNGWTFIGKNEGFTGGNGTVNMSGGTWNHNGSRTYVGLGNTTGKINLSGGTLNNTLGGNTDVFFGVGVLNNANATVPEVNLTGGNLNVNRLLSVGGVAVEGQDNNKDAAFQGSGKGKLTINSPTSVLGVTGEIWAGQGAGSNGQIVLNAGTINVNSWVAIGRGGGTGDLTMTGGTITKTGTGNFIIGASGPGTMTVSGGLVDIQNGLTWIGEQTGATSSALTIDGGEYRSGTISVAPRGAVGVLNLNGGIVRTNRFSGSAEDGSGANTGVGTINFNGTQIIASGNNNEFTRSTDTLNVAAGGMKVDSNNFTLVAPMPMSGVGGVTKSGAGSLTLSGANTFSGASSVTAGTLNITTDSTGGGALTVADSAALGVTQSVDTGVLNASALTLGSTTTGTTTLNFTAATGAANPTTALLKVNGPLSRSGTTTINLVDPLPAVGTLPLISYTSQTGTGTFVVGKLPDGVTLNSTTPIVDDGTKISLNITRVNAPNWTGANGSAWNTTTANWQNGFGGGSTTFQNGDPAIFQDATLTPSTYNVTLSTTVSPGGSGTTFDNASDFTLGGTGKISGTGGVTKRTAGDLSIASTLLNDFTGPVTIEGGSITVGLLTNAANAGPLGRGNLVLAGGALDYTGPAVTIDRGFQINAAANNIPSQLILANNVTMGGVVTATSGQLQLSGPGVLTLTNAGPNSLANGPQDTTPASLVIDGGGLTLSGTDQVTNVLGNTQIGTIDDSNPVLTLSGSSTLNVNRFQVGFGVGSNSSVMIQGLSQLHKSNVGWLSIGNSNNAIATVTVRDSGKLITDGGDFNVGDTATSNGSLIGSQSAVITSAGPVYIGKNGTTGSVSLSDNAAMSAGNTDVAGGTGSNGSLTLQQTATYTSGGRLQVGPGAGSTGTVTLSNAAHMQVNSFVSVGFGGGGTLTVKDLATFTTTDDLSVNENGDVAATVTVQDQAHLTAGGTVFIGRNANRVGTMTLSGTATFDQTGATTQNMIVGLAGTGTLNINGSANVNAASANGVILGNDGAGNGTVNLNGGTLTSKRVFGGAGTATFNFDGGSLKAAAGATAEFMTGLDNAFVEDGGAIIDSNGQDINIAQPLLAGVTPLGGLTKFGTGTLRLNGVNTYTGLTIAGVGSLGGTGTFAGPLKVVSGAALAPGSFTGTLTANGGVTLDSGSTFIVNIDDSQAVKNGSLVTTGNLNVTGVALQVNAIGAAGSAPYTIATTTGGTVTGPFASVPAGVSVVYNANSITITPPATTPFDSWMSNFPTLTGPNAAKGADPDGDGMTNLEEFALDGDPTTGASTGKVRSRIEAVGGEQALVITLPVRVGAAFDNNPGPGLDATVAGDGLVYLIQGSNNLTLFDQGVTEVTPASSADMPALSGPGWTYRTFRLNGAIPARGTKGFLSVKVQAP